MGWRNAKYDSIMANAIQTSQSSNFQPKYGSSETRGKVSHYKIFPHLYNDEQKKC